jgi:BirA family transcriptional regulator, biotin operon repressor / biotin---[acetyl-CoA-carboxylase] ligase
VATISPTTMIAAFAGHFAGWLARWRAGGFAPIREAWLGRAIGIGGPVQVRLERDTLDGSFLDLDDDGALLLGTATGSRRITAGEIFPAAG